jgi:heat shock protein HslJ
VLSACAVPRTAELANGPWQVTGVSNGQALVATKEAGSSMNLLLDGGGRASGQSGCNRFSAGYTQSGTQLQFSQAAGTRMMCVQPEGVMQYEAWMLAALTSVAAWSMDGDVLTLRTATGATALTLKNK